MHYVTLTEWHQQFTTLWCFSHNHTNTQTHKHTKTLTSTKQLLGYDRFWGLMWMALTRRSELFLSYFFLSPHTLNMTLSTSLIANGRQLGCSESVILHWQLCPVKLSTEFCMTRTAPLRLQGSSFWKREIRNKSLLKCKTKKNLKRLKGIL